MKFKMTASFNSGNNISNHTNFDASATMWFFTCQNDNFVSPILPIKKGRTVRYMVDDFNWVRIKLDSNNTIAVTECNSAWINEVRLYTNI